MQYQSCKIGERPTCLETKIILDPLRDWGAKIYTLGWIQHGGRPRFFSCGWGRGSRTFSALVADSVRGSNHYQYGTGSVNEKFNTALHSTLSASSRSDKSRSQQKVIVRVSFHPPIPQHRTLFVFARRWPHVVFLIIAVFRSSYFASPTSTIKPSWDASQCYVLTWILHGTCLLPRLSEAAFIWSVFMRCWAVAADAPQDFCSNVSVSISRPRKLASWLVCNQPWLEQCFVLASSQTARSSVGLTSSCWLTLG